MSTVLIIASLAEKAPPALKIEDIIIKMPKIKTARSTSSILKVRFPLMTFMV